MRSLFLSTLKGLIILIGCLDGVSLLFSGCFNGSDVENLFETLFWVVLESKKVILSFAKWVI